MPDRTGTQERIAIELANVLARVPSGLRSERLEQTLAELGFGFPGPIPAGVVSSADTAATAADGIPRVLEGLLNAVAAGHDLDIAARSLELITRFAQVTAGFVTLSNGLSAAGVPVPADFGQRLFDYFMIEHVDGLPAAGNILTLLGVVERIERLGTPGDPTRPDFTERHIHWNAIPALLSNPAGHFEALYDWGKPGFTGDKLLTALHEFIVRQGLPALLHPPSVGQPMKLEAFAFDLTPNPALVPPGLDLAVMFPVGGDVDVSVQLPHPAWTAHIKFDGQFLVGTSGTIRPPLRVELSPPEGEIKGQVRLAVEGAPASPFVLFGQAAKSRLEVAGVEAGVGFSFAWNSTTRQAQAEPLLEGRVSGGKVVIDNSQSDGFIASLLSNVKTEAAFDLGFAWSPSGGVRFEGTGSLEIELPIHIALGPVELTRIYLRAGLRQGKIPIEVSTALKAALGPLEVSVDRLGVEADVTFPPGGGNLGPGELDLHFKPPNGAGLSIDTALVKGGGYLRFDPEKGEYSGVAELSIAELVTVKAIGLISTKMPDGSKGFSLLVIISAEFQPIQLGFGFTLNAVGGLLGLNRSVMLDVLREGVRTGAVDSIMFPTNIVANAPRIISDLKAVFPPEEGTFLIGPMAKFGWGTPSLVTLSLGIIVEIPPGNIAILGVLKVVLPDEDAALIQLQVNFVGTLDFDKKLLAFDASLFDSRILFITLSGDMAVRLKWGDNAGFLLSVGGFHPSFQPPPLSLPTLRRISVSILDYDWARIRIDNYFAVTSNTVQFGARADLFFGVDGCNVSGDIGYDVLFQFSPFYFNALISGSLHLEVIGVDVLSIRLRLSLEGPTPWRAKGSGSVSILFWDIDVDFDVTWGDRKDTSLPPVQVMPIFIDEVTKQPNWKALPPPSSNLLVSMRKLDRALLVLHPFGALTITQRALPLGITLDKLGNQKPDDVSRVDITSATTGSTDLPLSPVQESFVPAQFQQMSDAEKLSRPSFQELKGGVIVGTAGGPKSSKMTRRQISYEITIIDKEPKKPLPRGRYHFVGAGLFNAFLRGASVSRSPLSFEQRTQRQPYPDKIAVSGEGFTVATSHDNKPFNAQSRFASEAMATDFMRRQLALDPSLMDAIHVLPNHEVNPS